MRKFTLSIIALAFAGAVSAAEPITIELKDGGKVFVDKDGTMAHIDAAGKREKMKDGKVMEAKDGSKVMMKNNAIWKTITEHGTLKPGH
ncbi:MAG: CopK family periplasmic copper-binding protein [Proteobacteria bacterium]|nr:CopK family periplasmic copper-binding protein [Pseudomonadota bacterium]